MSSLRLLSKGPKILFGKSGPIQWFLLGITIPIHPIFLIIRQAILHEARKTYRVGSELMESANYHVSQYIQFDLGIESHVELVIQLVLLLMVSSNTRTIIGMETLFGQENTIFYLPAQLALAISITLSIWSCVRSHLKGIGKKRAHSSTNSKASLLAFTFASIFIRVFTYILYLTPALGLFSVLSHLQGEMYPFLEPYYEHVNVTADTFYFGNAPEIPWSTITRWTYNGRNDADPPELTLYTIFSIGFYFCALWILLALNIVAQIVTERWSNLEVFTIP